MFVRQTHNRYEPLTAFSPLPKAHFSFPALVIWKIEVKNIFSETKICKHRLDLVFNQIPTTSTSLASSFLTHYLSDIACSAWLGVSAEIMLVFAIVCISICRKIRCFHRCFYNRYFTNTLPHKHMCSLADVNKKRVCYVNRSTLFSLLLC